ncbi:MAG: hypothetical protein NTV33_10880 [Coprothermobacterota bacterium]|nr:hypothetical protein [Coprothermobacterota bacterium]
MEKETKVNSCIVCGIEVVASDLRASFPHLFSQVDRFGEESLTEAEQLIYAEKVCAACSATLPPWGLPNESKAKDEEAWWAEEDERERRHYAEVMADVLEMELTAKAKPQWVLLNR